MTVSYADRLSKPAASDLLEVYRIVFDNNPSAVTVNDGKRYLYCNAAAVRLIGARDREHVLSLGPNDTSLVVQPDGRRSEEIASEARKRASTDGVVRIAEWCIKPLNSAEPSYVDVTILPTKLNGCDVVVVFMLDVDERVRARRQAVEKRAELEANFEAKIGGLVQALASAATEMEATASSLTAATEQASDRTRIVNVSAGQACSNVQAVAQMTDNLAAAIGEIGTKMLASRSATKQAHTDSAKTAETVEQLSGGAKRIGEVIKLISAIANQTKLLAFNAKIESARAGDAGAGFAVVASEVKELAGQTAKATDEVGARIAEIQDLTSRTVNDIKKIGAAVAEITNLSASVTEAIGEHIDTTAAIARSLAAAAQDTEEVSSSMSALNEASVTTRSAAKEIRDVASQISKQAEMLNESVGRFLAETK